jgi:hypothetical protein
MFKNLKFRSLVVVCIISMGYLMSSCWSARCPRATCRVRVEHRHGDKYFRPRAAMSWMWTPRYKHVRTAQVAGAGPNQIEAKKPWYKVWGPKATNKSQKPR